MNASTGFGASVLRKEDQRFLTGNGRYTDDINLPGGQCYAYFLRSPHAHAKIEAIDISHASQMPGVIAIYTGTDMVVGSIPCGWQVTRQRWPDARAPLTRP